MFWKASAYSLANRLERLHEVLHMSPDPNLEAVVRDAAMHRFKLVMELYWKILKKILSYEKIEAASPREVFQKAFQFQLIDNEEIWLAALSDRNSTSHLYCEGDSIRIFLNIQKYLPVLEMTWEKLKAKYQL
jgi:nucleotidyltransferase substrate binding protein (TIGR01987 family)